MAPVSNIPEPVPILKGHNGAVCSLAIGASMLYSGSRDCTVRVGGDLQTLQCIQVLEGHSTDVTSVLCWDSYLLSASMDNTLKVWAAKESGIIKMIYELKEDHGFVCGIHYVEAKPILLCVCKDNTVRLFDLPLFIERGRIFSKQASRVIQIDVDGLFFTGDAAGQLFG